MDNPAAEAKVRPITSSRLLSITKLVVGLLAAGWLAWALFGAGDQGKLAAAGWALPSSWVFVGGWFLLPLGLALLWCWTLVFSAGAHLPAAALLTTQGMAWAGRYMPGKAGLLLAKLTATRAAGASWREIGRTVVAEQALFVLAGLVFAALFLPLDNHWMQAADGSWLGEIIFSALSLAGHWLWRGLMVVALLFAAWLTLVVATKMFSLPGLGGTRLKWALVFGGHVLLHLLAGAALYPLVAALLPLAAAELGLLGVAGVFALANCAGVLAIIAPAGLGVREAALALCLSHGVGFEIALAVAAWLRVLTLVADAAFATLAVACGWFLGRKHTSVRLISE